MSAITAKASRKMKKYAVLTREPRCFLGSFDFSWEQRKAIDIADYSKGNGYSKGDLTDAGTPIILYGRLYTKYQFAISEVDTFAFPRNGAVYSQGNEVIVPASGETAEDIARASAVEKSGVLLGGDLNILRPFDFINPLFLALAISNGEPQKELAKKAQGKSVVHIHNTDIQEVTIAYPSRTEQDRIVSVFRQLDNLITLHQRKCALLFSPFQALISMMFTTSTFSWEQRKLGELALFNPKDELPQTFEYVDLESVVGTEMLSHRTEVKSSAPSRAQRLAHTGDLFYQTVRPYQKNNYLFEKPDNNYVFSTGYAQMRPYVDGYFLLSLVQSERFVKVVLDNCTGTSYPAINANDLAEIEVAAPSDESEAQRIGTIFRSIDNLITLHQRKCISFTGRAGRLISTVNKKRITSSWEQRKLGEVGETYTGLSGKSKDDFGHGSGKFITYMNVFSNPVASSNMTEAIEIDDSQNKVQFGDVLFTTSSETPDEVGMSSVWLENAENTYLNSFCFGYRPTTEYNPYYLAYMLRSSSMRKKITFLAQGISRYNISKNKMMDIEMPIPSIDEQKQIGEYFRNLDNLITLHQRKPFLMKWRNSDANRNQTNRLVL